MGPRAGVDDVEKRKLLTLPGLELGPVGRPALRHSICHLRYRGCYDIIYEDIFFLIPFRLICTSTFSKLCNKTYTVACRRVLTSTPL
jgi:hypothetical protein